MNVKSIVIDHKEQSIASISEKAEPGHSQQRKLQAATWLISATDDIIGERSGVNSGSNKESAHRDNNRGHSHNETFSVLYLATTHKQPVQTTRLYNTEGPCQK